MGHTDTSPEARVDSPRAVVAPGALVIPRAMVATPIACIVPAVDEGLPIAYQLLDNGVPAPASDGTPAGYS